MSGQFTPNKLSLVLRLSAGLLLSAVSLYLALRTVDPVEIGAALASADARWVGLALLSVAVNTLGKAARWKVLLGLPGERVSLVRALMALLVGQTLNTLYPARLGELSRAYLVGGMGPGRAFTLGTVALEKLIDLTTYTLLFFLLILSVPLPAWMGGSAFTFAGVVGLVMLAVLFFVYRPEPFLLIFEKLIRWLPARLREFVGTRTRSALACLKILRGRPEVLKLAAWTGLIWGTAILTNRLVLQALDLHLPWAASLLVLISLQAGIAIPSVPGRIGIFEAICILALAVFGIGQATALSYGIILHTIVLLPSTLLGLLCFWLLGLGSRRAELTGA